MVTGRNLYASTLPNHFKILASNKIKEPKQDSQNQLRSPKVVPLILHKNYKLKLQYKLICRLFMLNSKIVFISLKDL
jgi:hypothetical protein